MTVHKDIVEAPLWANLGTFIENAACLNFLQLSIYVNKELSKDKIKFEVEGPSVGVNAFKKLLNSEITDIKRNYHD